MVSGLKNGRQEAVSCCCPHHIIGRGLSSQLQSHVTLIQVSAVRLWYHDGSYSCKEAPRPAPGCKLSLRTPVIVISPPSLLLYSIILTPACLVRDVYVWRCLIDRWFTVSGWIKAKRHEERIWTVVWCHLSHAQAATVSLQASYD